MSHAATPISAPGSSAPPPGGALALTEDEFRRIAAIADRTAGLSIPATKRTMVQSRLVRRLRATGRASFADYLALFDGAGCTEEIPYLISALTTNVSSFFREEHHFQTLRSDILPGLLERARRAERVRLWSAGCSTGQEPYSIAMEILDADPKAANYDLRILATDIDRAVLARARTGLYSDAQTEAIPAPALKRWTEPAPDGGERRVSEAVRRLVSFRYLNLIEPWPMSGTFDVVFCRNVVIYFSEATQEALWPRFAQLIRPGGSLFLGHSERVHEPAATGFAPTGVTSYRRLGSPAPRKENV